MAGVYQVTTTAEICAAVQAEGKISSYFEHYKHIAEKSGLPVEDLIHMGRAGAEIAGELLVDWDNSPLPSCPLGKFSTSKLCKTPSLPVQHLAHVLCVAPDEAHSGMEVVLLSGLQGLLLGGSSSRTSFVLDPLGHPKSIGKPRSHSLVHPLSKHNPSCFFLFDWKDGTRLIPL